MTIAGLLLGLGAAAGLAWWLRSLLFDVEPFAMPVYAGVCLILVAAITLATVLPARRATRVDPLIALRTERDLDAMKVTLGAFEELVLMAVEALGDAAYSANLQRTLEREARRPVSLGAVHSSLERLEAKRLLGRLLASRQAAAAAGGVACFRSTRDGRAALRDVQAVRQRLLRTSSQ